MLVLAFPPFFGSVVMCINENVGRGYLQQAVSIYVP